MLMENVSLDIDLPADCDDIHWYDENPEVTFRQPPGKPSQLAFFTASLKLSNILSNAFRFLVSALQL